MAPLYSFVEQGQSRKRPPQHSICGVLVITLRRAAHAVVVVALVRGETEGNGHDKTDDNPQRQNPVDDVHTTSSLFKLNYLHTLVRRR